MKVVHLTKHKFKVVDDQGRWHYAGSYSNCVTYIKVREVLQK